jgi:hypothetical protein
MARFTQVRGVSGAGKSTLVRRLFEDYGAEHAGMFRAEDVTVPIWRCRGGLHILGRYTPGSPVGAGGDMLHKESRVRSVLRHCDRFPLVVWESLWGSPEPARDDEFDHKTTWAMLDTPFDQCMSNVRERRRQKGEDPDKKLNEDKFAAEFRRMRKHATARGEKGRPVITLPFGDDGYNLLKQVLYFDGWRPDGADHWQHIPWDSLARTLRRSPAGPEQIPT